MGCCCRFLVCGDRPHSATHPTITKTSNVSVHVKLMVYYLSIDLCVVVDIIEV